MAHRTDTCTNTFPRSEQWAPDGLLNAIPGPILRLLAVDGQTFGYAPTDGWAFAFGYLHEGKEVDIEVLPGQWVTRYPDNRVAVTDQRPTEDYAAQNPRATHT